MSENVGPRSDFDFNRARRAADLGWTTPAAVEAALRDEERSPGPGIVARVGLNDAQRRALHAPAFPADVAEALRDPARGVARFVLLERLGSGGMGDVWRAWDLKLARPVALKLLRRIEDPRPRACFEREARVLAALKLAGVPAIHEIGEHEGAPYIAMELIEGEALARTRKPLEARRAAELIGAAARTVDAAHRAGIVHRDLKPGNLMLDRDGRLFVTDFGLAKPLAEGAPGASLTGSGFVVGTPEYMPPEQARGGPEAAAAADARSDVYALGACLFELLTGRPPFVSKDRGEVIAQVLRDLPPRPRALAPGTPAPLEAIALRCLEKDPALRYPSAGDLANDLERFLEGGRVVATLRRIPRRRAAVRAAAIGGFALGLALLLVLGLSWSSTSDKRSEPVAIWRGEEGVDIPCLAVSDEKIFAGLYRGGTGSAPAASAIVALPLDGSGPPARLYDAPFMPFGIALAGDDLFWVDPSSGRAEGSTRAFRARKDGRGEPAVIFEGWAEKPPIEDAWGLGTDGSALFIVDAVGGGVVRMSFDGSEIAPLAPPRYEGGFPTEHHNSIACADGEIFVVNSGFKGVIDPEVAAVPTSGGPWRRLCSGLPLVLPRAIAAHRGVVYVADPGAGQAVFAIPAGGGTPEVIHAGPPFVDIRSLAVAGDALLVGDYGNFADDGQRLTDGPPAIWRIDIGARRAPR